MAEKGVKRGRRRRRRKCERNLERGKREEGGGGGQPLPPEEDDEERGKNEKVARGRNAKSGEREREEGGKRERNTERRGERGDLGGLGIIASCTDEHEPSRNNAIRGQPCLVCARTPLVLHRTRSLLPAEASTRA